MICPFTSKTRFRWLKFPSLAGKFQVKQTDFVRRLFLRNKTKKIQTKINKTKKIQTKINNVLLKHSVVA